MAWNGSGTFTRAGGATEWADDEANGIGIESAPHDAADNDLATGINNCLTKDGQNAATDDLPMGGFKHENVGVATERNQYGRVSQIQDNTYLYGGTSGVAGGVNVQTSTLAPAITAYASGSVIWFLAGGTNTSATVTMNVNGVGAKTVKRPGVKPLDSGDITAGNYYQLIKDNGDDVWILTNPTPTWNSFTPSLNVSAGSAGSVSATGTRYIIHLDGTVEAAYKVSWTQSGVEAVTATLSLPVTAADTAGGGGFINLSGLLTEPGGWYFSSTTAITLKFASGTLFELTTHDIRVTVSYKAA